jgi:peptide/nickel transport system ATP-binding protein
MDRREDQPDPVLDIAGLSITFPSPSGRVRVVDDISFAVGKERLAIVGESGSGKTMTARALVGLVPGPGIVACSRFTLLGRDLRNLSERDWRKVRGARIAMILQDPRFSLNPVKRIGAQVAESYAAHNRAGRARIRSEVLDALAAVKIADPLRVVCAYPHEISGGMGQRVMIAMMLMGKPDILIADEPTSALDVTLKHVFLELIDEIVKDRGMALILISHELDLVRSFCNRVIVMKQGQIVDRASARQLLQSSHPYTRALLAARPRLDVVQERLPTVRWAPGAGDATREH